jgi:hypothetical protein
MEAQEALHEGRRPSAASGRALHTSRFPSKSARLARSAVLRADAERAKAEVEDAYAALSSSEKHYVLKQGRP